MALGATECIRSTTNVVQIFRAIRNATSVRHKSTFRGRWHAETRTFQERLDAISASDRQRNHLMNIGLPINQAEHVAKEQQKERKRKKSSGWLEFSARHRQLKLDMDAVCSKWITEKGPQHIHSIAEHYNIYHDLFGEAFFFSVTPVHICYEYDERFVTPVYYGNRIPPSEAAVMPFVDYESDSDELWTLVMTSPDGNLQRNDRECLHWLVTNIPGSDVRSGETLCDYLQPFPVKGAGYLRYVFVLYKQKKHIDFSCHRCPNWMVSQHIGKPFMLHYISWVLHRRVTPNRCLKAYAQSVCACEVLNGSLSQRTFSTAEFYRQHREDITPASIRFFQSRWDMSVTSVFHNVLEMKEPSYEFVPPARYMYSLWTDDQGMFLSGEKLWTKRDRLEEVLEKIREATTDSQHAHWPKTSQLQLIMNPPLTEIQYEAESSLLESVPSPCFKLQLKVPRLQKHQSKDLCPEE